MPMKRVLQMLVCFCVVVAATPAFADEIHIAAAISMKESLDEAATAFKAHTGNSVQFSYGSSGAMVAQIKSGSDTDIFISAAQKQMNDLDAAKLIEPATRRVLATNELVIIVPADSKILPSDFPALLQPTYKRIALGEPKTVPAGDYAIQVLKHLKLLDPLTDRLVYGANVRQVLVYVEHGEVDAGIVYRTDAKQAGNQVRVAATANTQDHAPIDYPAALLSASQHKKTAQQFLNFLATADAQKIFITHGFIIPGQPTPTAATRGNP